MNIKVFILTLLSVSICKIDANIIAAQYTEVGKALSYNQFDTVKELIKNKKASVDDSAIVPDENFKKEPLLCYAVKCYALNYSNFLKYNWAKESSEKSMHGFFDIILFLLEHKASVNLAEEKSQDTALHIATQNKLPAEMITTLLKFGANPLQTNAQGKTAVAMALYEKHTVAEKLFKDILK